MKKNYFPLIAFLFISGIIFWIYYSMMPKNADEKNVALSQFSTQRALDHVAILSKSPHYIGSKNHKTIANYLENEFQKLGIETKPEEGFTLTEWGNLTKSRNILGRIKGTNNSKALLLLSHYDSAPHSKSKGASDDASGIATILEGLRAFLHNKTPHENDIIVLFSDAEELGLNGAALFVTQNQWASEVGLALNFEARGTSGPSYMLMEVNKGNTEMVESFSDAKVDFVNSNSLMYSIYKMLPNDTDLTVFREQKQIHGFNFAFIDNHFNYHTEQDDLQHMDKSALAHQGSYLMPLLNYYSNKDLKNTNSEEDNIYFNTPFCFVNYPFSWIFPMLGIAIVLFFGMLFVGFGKRILDLKTVGNGFLLFFITLVAIGAFTFFAWKIILMLYPQYNDILQGFTYNGHAYIYGFMAFTLSVCFFVYRKFSTENQNMNFVVAPIFIWILINAGVAIFLKGAGFFIIPILASLIGFGYFTVTQKTNNVLNLILTIPSLIIFVPFITTLPIGLGLKLLFASSILVVLVFGLLIPVFGDFHKKGNWSVLFFILAVGFFVNAHVNADYEFGKAKPNSLVYYFDADTKKAFWTTYDKNLDAWTKQYLGENPQAANDLNSLPMFSKYDSKFTFKKIAEIQNIAKPKITFLKDSISGNFRMLKIKIAPNRKVNRYDIFANQKMEIYNLTANGAKNINQKTSKLIRENQRILSYYVIDNLPLELSFSIPKATFFDMKLIESSFDLLEQKQFNVAKRQNWMMPTPFVLNDAVLLKMNINEQL